MHETRVEVDAHCTEEDLYYIRGDERITDVLVSENDGIESFFQVAKIIRILDEIPHVNAIRLRSLMFNYEPEYYTAEVIDKLASLNKLCIANPKRLEIETQFLSPDEFRPEHGQLAVR